MAQSGTPVALNYHDYVTERYVLFDPPFPGKGVAIAYSFCVVQQQGAVGAVHRPGHIDRIELKVNDIGNSRLDHNTLGRAKACFMRPVHIELCEFCNAAFFKLKPS